MIYIASPYSHPDPAVVERRFLAVEEFTAELMRKGEMAYSPIVHCHAVASRHAMPTDAAYWQAYNEHFIRRCDAMFVLCIDGWEDSKGVTDEIAFWRGLGCEPEFHRRAEHAR